MRRRYDPSAHCDNCGRTPATVIRWWATALPYKVCATCIRPYRNRILYPTPEWCRDKADRNRHAG